MTMAPAAYAGGMPGQSEPANLGDILERVLDRGIVIAGDIKINLLDIELLTIKLRLLVVSVETAREMGIDWWEQDPWLSPARQDLASENRRLRERLDALGQGDGDGDRRALGGRKASEEPVSREGSEGPVSRRRNRGD
ncbi:MAG: gas vesicle protein [Acidimicrobiaceae bacterium]|nr:gas vesicle protein [Acidimicrobiaceae bacterium]